MPRSCSVPDCLRPHSAKGLCQNHYQQERYKNPDVQARKKARQGTPEYRAWQRQYERQPHVRAKNIQRLRQYRQRPEVKARPPTEERRAAERARSKARYYRMGGVGYQRHRFALHAAQHGRCAICAVIILPTGKDSEVDHIYPVSKGGTNDVTNLQLLCPSCNRSKRDRV